MNINPLARGYKNKNMDGEAFIIHVVKLIERQLKEWDPEYEINLLKLADYEIWIKKNEAYCYEINISESELEAFQKKCPYCLDIVIWKRLEAKGLQIKKGYGNYLDIILP